MNKKLPRHIVRLLILLSGLLFVSFAARSFLIDPSFYRFGNYRADAVPELAAGEPVYRGAAYCGTCHEKKLADWAGSNHLTVQCEVCHGADQEHPDDAQTHVPTDTIRLCTTCHEAMPARPATQPQIVVAEHPFPDEAGQQCHGCHDPHSPGALASDAVAIDTNTPAETSTEPSIDPPAAASKCSRCHGKLGEGVKKNPALAGLESSVFIELMNSYITGARDHKAMAKYARALSDEELTELADYYQRLQAGPPDQ